jgi:hypothetical protein
MAKYLLSALAVCLLLSTGCGSGASGGGDSSEKPASHDPREFHSKEWDSDKPEHDEDMNSSSVEDKHYEDTGVSGTSGDWSDDAALDREYDEASDEETEGGSSPRMPAGDSSQGGGE